ncbi:MAG: UDP-N-acetylmuramoyl-L-alanine--D-glutamate ligase [Cyanobacteria bacterium P01_F01_bin.33]
MRVQVLGLGKSGIAAARLLSHQGQPTCVSDERDSPDLRQRQLELQALGIEVQLGSAFAIHPSTDTVVVSPGIDWYHPVLTAARDRGVTVMGEAELAWQVLSDVPWVGITGTNGKTTTTALVAAIFAAAALNAPACGNIGLPLCSVALQALTSGMRPDWIIAELSTYQIEAASSLAPAIGAWTTFTADHLARHGSMEAYAALKASLIRRSRQQVLNDDDAYLSSLHADWPQARWVSCQHHHGAAYLQTDAEDRVWAWFEGEPVLPLDELQLIGEHNHQNLLVAIAIARMAGVNVDCIREAVANFAGVPHRLERVRTINCIQFVNDSKATNYEAAQVALTSIPGPIVLIAGGQPKAGDDREWIACIKNKVVATVLIGEAAEKFRDRLSESEYTDYHLAQTLDVAVPLAFKLAQTLKEPVMSPETRTPSITVLLSPACASFDQYSNFERRGDHFRQCCAELAG